MLNSDEQLFCVHSHLSLYEDFVCTEVISHMSFLSVTVTNLF